MTVAIKVKHWCGAEWSGHKPEHCVVCHETFSTTRAGDRHRRADTQGAISCQEPLGVGLVRGSDNVWHEAPTSGRPWA